MSGIFLSYRRLDSDFAVLLHCWLAERFGANQLFWDHEDIDPGNDFRDVLSKRLRSCNALVALIGANWTPSDWIQREIGAALRRKIFVLPVLVGGAPPLESSVLPPSIRALADRQALSTSDDRFRTLLTSALAKYVAEHRTPPKIDETKIHRLIELLTAQADRRQREALDLISAGEAQRALEVLSETFDILMVLREWRPTDARLDVRLGFLYKDLAQSVPRDSDQSRHYAKLGLQLFDSIIEERLNGLDHYFQANAWNGLGNVRLLLGDAKGAIACIRRAVALVPAYGFAWSDLFQAYEARAQSGTIDISAMARALRGMRDAGDPELLAEVLPAYERRLRGWEKKAVRQRRRPVK